MEKPCVCFHCKSQPNVVMVSDVYYVQCPNCNKWYLWEFCGSSKHSAIKQWNNANSDGKHWSGVEA